MGHSCVGYQRGGGCGKDPSLTFSSCQTFLEKYQIIHGPGFLASKYTGPYSGDSKQAMSEGPSSPWTQLAQPLGPPCQDAVPAQCPLPPPPQVLPCPPACHPEKPESYSSLLPLPPLGAHKRAGYQDDGLSSPYLSNMQSRPPTCPQEGWVLIHTPLPPCPYLHQASSWNLLMFHSAHWTLSPKLWVFLMPGITSLSLWGTPKA